MTARRRRTNSARIRKSADPGDHRFLRPYGVTPRRAERRAERRSSACPDQSAMARRPSLLCGRIAEAAQESLPLDLARTVRARSLRARCGYSFTPGPPEHDETPPDRRDGRRRSYRRPSAELFQALSDCCVLVRQGIARHRCCEGISECAWKTRGEDRLAANRGSSGAHSLLFPFGG